MKAVKVAFGAKQEIVVALRDMSISNFLKCGKFRLLVKSISLITEFDKNNNFNHPTVLSFILGG